MAALLLKLTLYGAALGAAGLALTSLAILPSAQAARNSLRFAAGLAAAAAGSAALRLGLETAALAGGWSSIFEPPYLGWTLAAQGSFLALLAIGVAILGVGGLLGRRPLAAVGALTLLASFTATGHVAGEDGAAWLRVVLGVHLVGVAVWVAAPPLLWPRRVIDDAALLARVKAFSRIAVGLIPIAVAAGVVLAVVLVSPLSRLTDAAYGRLILVKISAASAAFALGGLNKVWVTARLAANPSRGRALLRLTLGAETLLFATALAAVAAATTLFPPEA